MTPRQKELVKSGFENIMPIAREFTELFFSRLFEIAPSLRLLVRGDIQVQEVKLIQMLGNLVSSLEYYEEIIPVLRDLGYEYSSIGVCTAHYDAAESALLWTLERGLGRKFTEEMRSAWEKMISSVIETMKQETDELHDIEY